MKVLRNFLDNVEHLFVDKGKLQRLYPLYEAFDTFVYTPKDVTKGTVHIRDGIDLKRMMTIVVLAAIPCLIFGLYNTGFLANKAAMELSIESVDGWRGWVLSTLGLALNPENILSNFIHGLLYWLPIYIVTNVAGGLCEVVFSIVRKHEINEGFFVTGMLFPLIVPATIPLWQVALSISFAVIFAKEVFGGTGRNFLNPALVARAFLFFAYPAEISGDAVWVAIDGFTGATALGQAQALGVSGISLSISDAFFGFMSGSIGDTSTLACLLGAFVLIVTGVGSWRIMLSVVLSTVLFSSFLLLFKSGTNPMFTLGPAWHMVLGGFAFATVFMATDPVSAPSTLKGHYF